MIRQQVIIRIENICTRSRINFANEFPYLCIVVVVVVVLNATTLNKDPEGSDHAAHRSARAFLARKFHFEVTLQRPQRARTNNVFPFYDRQLINILLCVCREENARPRRECTFAPHSFRSRVRRTT